ncbi:MAG: hypothetical protein JXR96_07980 [Deltaproteobacteria bacterium]|nr:hypothetical protein [Deltaproteobacteria bacterium]
MEIGRIAIRVHNPGSIPAALRNFVSEGPASIDCQGRFAAVETPAGPALFDSGGVWRIHGSAQSVSLVLRAAGRDYHRLDLDPDLLGGRVCLDPGGIEDRALFALRAPMLELWCSFLLMRGTGLLVHGCGWLIDGRVHVFAGPSGAGKTTLARLIERAGAGELLSDDRLVIRPEAGAGFAVCGTPWHGEARFASPACGPLAGLYFLRHAPAHALRPLSPRRAAEVLFACCFVAGWPREGLAHVLDTAARIAESVPAWELAFAPRDDVLECLEIA